MHKFCTCCLFHRKVAEIAESQPLSSLASSFQVVYVNGYTHTRSMFFWRGVFERRYVSFYFDAQHFNIARWCFAFSFLLLLLLILTIYWSLLFVSFLWWIFKQNSYCPEVTYAVGWKLDKELTPFIEAYNLLHITVISVSVTNQCYIC